ALLAGAGSHLSTSAERGVEVAVFLETVEREVAARIVEPGAAVAADDELAVALARDGVHVVTAGVGRQHYDAVAAAEARIEATVGVDARHHAGTRVIPSVRTRDAADDDPVARIHEQR